MNTKTSKYDDFQYINNSFQNYIKRRTTHPLHFLNFCSTKEEQEFLMELSEIIKKIHNSFLPTNYSCNFGNGSGCLCVTKKNMDYLTHRGYNN